MIRLKRVYETPAKGDGFRILVDRLWPRGLSKEKAKVDLWLKEIAPSSNLRKWFAHDPSRWEDFKKKYWDELKTKSKELTTLTEKIKEGTVTLCFGAKDEEHNNAVVLKEYLQRKKKK